MSSWNPDSQFLDFLIELCILDGANPDETAFDEVPDGKEYTLREGIEKMRVGQEEYWKNTYTEMYQDAIDNEGISILFESYKAEKEMEKLK